MKKPAIVKELHSVGNFPVVIADCYQKAGNITLKCQSFIKNTQALLRTFHPGKKSDLNELSKIGVPQDSEWEDVFNRLSNLKGSVVRVEIREAKNPKYRNITSFELGDKDQA